MAIMDYDERGKCAGLTIRGQRFTPLAGETEDDLCARAAKETGTTDELMLVQLVHSGPNGGLAPGFERFGKRV